MKSLPLTEAKINKYPVQDKIVMVTVKVKQLIEFQNLPQNMLSLHKNVIEPIRTVEIETNPRISAKAMNEFINGCSMLSRYLWMTKSER